MVMRDETYSFSTLNILFDKNPVVRLGAVDVEGDDDAGDDDPAAAVIDHWRKKCCLEEEQ